MCVILFISIVNDITYLSISFISLNAYCFYFINISLNIFSYKLYFEARPKEN